MADRKHDRDEERYPHPSVVVRACLALVRHQVAHQRDVSVLIDGHKLTGHDLIRALAKMVEVADEPEFKV